MSQIIKDIQQKHNKDETSEKLDIQSYSALQRHLFDQFKNFEDRGDKFKKLIYKMRSKIY